MKKSAWWSLFGLPFAAVGLIALGVAASGVWDAYRMQSWKPVPAKLLSVELETNRGDDSTTQRVRARYRYSDLGRTHESERVAIYGFADNIGDFHAELYAELQAAFASGEPVTAYVNPVDYTDAVLSRDPRWRLTALIALFGLIFAGVGIALMVGIQLGARKLGQQSEKQRLYPDEPWRWREEWHDGTVQDAGNAAVYVSAGFAALWILISVPVAFGVLDEVRDGNYLALIGLVFPIVGIGLALWAFNTWLRRRRYGASTIALGAVPIPLGGVFQGEIKVNASVPVEKEFLLRLSCIEIRRRSGGRNSRSERIRWQDEQTVSRHRCQLGPTSSTIPFEFSLPGDQPGTREPGEDNEIQWRLEVNGVCPGADYAGRFMLPIYTTGAPSPAPPEEPRDYARVLDPTQLTELGSRGIRVDRLPDGTEQWTFGRARHKGVATAITVFSFVWCGFVGIMFSQGAPVWFAGLFAFFAALLLWGAAYAWLAQQRVTVSHLGIGLRGGIIPAGRPKQYSWAEIADIKPVKGMSSGNKLYYDLKLETGDRVLPVAARSIDNLKTAEQIAASWERFKP